MPHVKHPVSNPAHGCAPKLHLIGFGLCSKPELKTEQEVRFLNKLLVLKSAHGCAPLASTGLLNVREKEDTSFRARFSLSKGHTCGMLSS